MKIVSFNLRCVWAEEGVNSFIHRAGMIVEKINKEKPDIICFQEGTEKNISFLRRTLPEYDIVFNQRDADYGGEGLATALRRENMELKKLDFFWLSETPDVPGSRFPNQGLPRICQSLLVKDPVGRFIRIYNIHLDHVNEDIRVLGMGALLTRVAEDSELGDFPFFILGDYNALPESETIGRCNACARTPMADLTAGCGDTFHGFGMEAPMKIDYIYTNRQNAERPHTVTLWDEKINGIYLSDHYPVALDIEL